MEKETNILKTIKHWNVVSLKDHWETFDSYNYILEYIKGDDLTIFLKNRGKVLEEWETKKLAKILL